MSRFLQLYEEFHPANTGNDKFELIDFLQSHGIEASLVKSRGKLGSVGDDTVSIDHRFYVTVSNAEEEGQDIISSEVQDEANNGDTNATSLLQQRKPLVQQVQNLYKTGTTNIQKAIQDQQKRNQVSNS